MKIIGIYPSTRGAIEEATDVEDLEAGIAVGDHRATSPSTDPAAESHDAVQDSMPLLDPIAAPRPPKDQPGMPRPRSEGVCIRFVQLHYQYRGISRNRARMLRRMIEMMSEIGYEVRAMRRSSTLFGSSLDKISCNADFIMDGCCLFDESYCEVLNRVCLVADDLPVLDDIPSGEELNSRLGTWVEKMKVLHKPTGNDTRLFQMVQEHFDQVAYHPLLHLRSLYPHPALEEIVERAVEIHGALRNMHVNTADADRGVNILRKAFGEAMRRPPVFMTPEVVSTGAVDGDLRYSASPELLAAAEYEPASDDANVSQPQPHLSKSFGAAEEEIARRGHARASTFPETEYIALSRSVSAVEPIEQPVHNSAISSRRKLPNVPRIFTGSFSQLESGIRKLQLDKVETPTSQSFVSEHDVVKVRDFGDTPDISRCPSPGTSPTVSLQRREAFLTKDTEVQDRMINGTVVATRRPSTKGRAHTFDDRSGGLEAWLREVSSGSPTAVADGAHRSPFKQRERTL